MPDLLLIQRFKPAQPFEDVLGRQIVAAAVRHEWSVARRYIAETYLVGTYRYNGKTSTRTAIYTGAVLDNAGGEVFASREEAMAALMSRRNATRRARPR